MAQNITTNEMISTLQFPHTFSTHVISTPAFSSRALHSCAFHPRFLIPRFPLLRFHSTHLRVYDSYCCCCRLVVMLKRFGLESRVFYYRYFWCQTCCLLSVSLSLKGRSTFLGQYLATASHFAFLFLLVVKFVGANNLFKFSPYPMAKSKQDGVIWV